MNEKKFSDEFLHAFVDDQLSAEEKSRAYPIISQDPSLNQHVCEIRKLRDLVQLAYKEPPSAPAGNTPHGRKPIFGGFLRNAVAVLLLSIGAVLGWALHSEKDLAHTRDVAAIGTVTQTQSATVVASKTANAHKPVAHAINAPRRGQETKIILHINRGGTERMGEVLDEAENLMELYRHEGKPIRVEVIANGEGLNLLRADVSPYAQRIRELQKKYDKLTFAACQNTIDRLKREQGIQARLVPEAVVIDSGVAQIILLQQQGWAYIQV